MVYDLYPKGPAPEPSELNRHSYNPLHDYRTVDVDAWAEQWFAFLSDLDPDSQEYQEVERTLSGQMALHPDTREVDARDVGFNMRMLRLIGSKNPFNANAESAEERMQHDWWQRDWQYARATGRQMVRFVLADAERYAALRVEGENADTDYLTGLPNRRGLDHRLAELYGITHEPFRLDEAGDQLPPVRLTHIYGDINGFKWINDNLGHHVGDRVLAETAVRARAFFRRSEHPIIYREGGDEFGTIVCDLDPTEAEELAQRMVSVQVDKATSEHYRQTMYAVKERLHQPRRSGQRVRAEARAGKLTQEDMEAGIGVKHVLYINGDFIAPLYDIVTLATGVKFGRANNLDDVEQLRRSAEEAMGGAKPVFRSIIDTIRPNGNSGGLGRLSDDEPSQF